MNSTKLVMSFFQDNTQNLTAAGVFLNLAIMPQVIFFFLPGASVSSTAAY